MNCKNEAYVFDDQLLVAKNYDESILPDMVRAASPSDLRNIKPDNVFNFEWILIDKSHINKE